MHRLLLILGSLALLVATAPGAGAEAPLFPSAELRAHVEYLASDQLGGRETGTTGCRIAEDYIADSFREYGLAPLDADGDYFLEYTLYETGFNTDVSKAVLTAGKRELEGDLGYDLRPFSFTATGEAEAEVVFAGYGITAPEYDYDDYEGLDVEGKFVLVFRYEPRGGDWFDGESSSQHAFFRTKARNAKAHGALGMLLFTAPLDAQPSESLRLPRGLTLDAPEGEDTPGELFAAQIHQDWGGYLVETTGMNAAQLQQAIEDGERPVDHPLENARVRLVFERRHKGQAVPVRNVAALLSGRDPVLADEWIVIGAHHDHVGMRSWGPDRIFNGADDNASGTATVLALAKAWAQRERPPRSIAFLTFSGEEKGLLGSRATVEQQLIPMEKVAFMLNLDMVGRNSEYAVEVMADGSAYGLRDWIEQINKDVGLQLDYSGRRIPSNSDHFSFYKADVPVLFLSTGTHIDYHRVGDHADKIDYDRMGRIIRLSDELVGRLARADGDELPRFAHIVDWMGAEIEVVPADRGKVARVRDVAASARGQEAGLRPGDIVVAIEGDALERPDDVSRKLDDVKEGRSVRLSLKRGARLMEIDVFKAPHGYLGIQRQRIRDRDRRELDLPGDEGVLVQEVLPGGPASDAGLQSGDILLRVGGVAVGFQSLIPRLAQLGAGTEVEVTLLRDGRRLKRAVTLGQRPQGG